MEVYGYTLFHFTNLPAGMHALTWVPEVNQKGIQWNLSVVVVGRFFEITELFEQYGNEALTYEDAYIFVLYRPESWGMTTVHIKKKKNYKENIDDWSDIFEDRNRVIGYFQREREAFYIDDLSE